MGQLLKGWVIPVDLDKLAVSWHDGEYGVMSLVDVQIWANVRSSLDELRALREGLGAKPWGTLVNVALVVETSGSLRHLLCILTGRQKTEQYLDEVLSRLNNFS